MTKVFYINTRTRYGVETLESVNRNEFPDPKSFRKEYLNLLQHYRALNLDVYLSRRASKK